MDQFDLRKHFGFLWFKADVFFRSTDELDLIHPNVYISTRLILRELMRPAADLIAPFFIAFSHIERFIGEMQEFIITQLIAFDPHDPP